MKVLLVEDNHQVMETLCDFLELSGHQVDCAYHGEAALQLLRSHSFDVVVMDIMMPKLDGIQTVQQLRQQQRLNLPVLFLTARDSLDDKIAAFGAGGDDYLVKPFSMQELLLRLEALTKRRLKPEVTQLQVGNLLLDPDTQQISVQGNTVRFSKIQLQLMKLLMQHYPAMVSRAQLEDAIWGEDTPDSDALRSHIYALRHSLTQENSGCRLETVHGQGYRLVSN